MIRKLVAIFIWFIVFCALLSLLLTLAANAIDFGREPGGPYRAGAALQERFGGWYTAAVSVAALLMAVAGTLSGKLPGSRKKSTQNGASV